ncbi:MULTISPECIES: phosphopyruvate hydratase [Rhodococcus]|uniref:Enolase n=1 Tax=Rhodococcus oxybenzonivorans TaxID=1990687 RepID=A0AAE5A7V7_9NOCA|nr:MULTISPECIES: phosphopyruvate hydratase [Rhodococcus]MDV7241119.1 phosphopyruvate hydratase [Rhodococcus oxybenzonivorans]MDV7266901.1 phosphopyruvate hydratase [Rhodococcus oxybenzonivorans]MDV7273392.1 phosphopyruvate hydratase [Rhodococcus oxybenzonivorans]MDV7332870.1 phosphopyruvate hydratase [Rhodococcus oxybenzonivorans]MDV7342036.1 phosphopyruvate hydratase [Rhodococcus oxybenzonivorans]
MSGTRIKSVFSWEALDSRGNPTVATEVTLHDGTAATAIVPSGASTGTHEAVELRDGGIRYGGKGVTYAVANANTTLRDAVCGIDATDQRAVDAALREADGTPHLSTMGSNAVLSVSIASARAAARAAGLPLYAHIGNDPLLPLPMVNVISGGAHADGAVDIQDFLVVPVGADSFHEAIEFAWRVRRGTAQVLEDAGYDVALVADEGGLGPRLPSNRAALEFLARGVAKAGLDLGAQAAIAIDVAATEFYDVNSARYHFASENRHLSSSELIAELEAWSSDFPIVSIEDILSEDDWDHWPKAQAALPSTQLLGDDLFVTNPQRLAQGVDRGAANAVLVKPNQIGTLSQAREVVDFAREHNVATVLSARSGESEDSWLSDLAVGWRTGQIKVGSTTRSERTAKWNRLLEIEAKLGSSAQYAGAGALAPDPV